jgi:hypothetical protein
MGATARAADSIRLPTGLNLNWNINSQPSGSDFLVIPIANDSPSGSPILAGWDLNLEVVPEAGATGTLSIDSATVAFPGNNNVLSTANGPALTVTPSGTPSTTVQLDALDTVQNSAEVVPSIANLVQLRFTSADAAGNFTLEAISNGSATAWSDESGNNIAFTNEGSVINLGTVSVVPEPSSLLLAALSAMGIAGYRGGRRLKKHLSRKS